MIDIHSHLLPGVDDGSAEMEESLAMARSAARQGIRKVIATPHHNNGRYVNPAAEVRRAVAELGDRLRQEGIPLDVLPGQEIRLTGRLLEDWDAGQLLTLADTPYILLEMMPDFEISHLAEAIHELKVRGLIPVIAHPERHPELARRPEWFGELVELGALGQVTSHSLLGRFGHMIRRAAFRMCREGTIHLVATDAHDLLRRGFDLKEAYELIRKEFGLSYAELLEGNAEALLRSETVQAAIQTRRWRKAWFF
ncbi:tyrosine-protein phosphatase [Cohnella fermenti]|uniref:Tyrosine-protein phosphatase n=1 Tax=Cohnella fermenti TaxID=2565925 RepID=A0A4V3WE37_9BACL|nr:CpsB/CapC family capsule biosynthesis tyrosine phosphatase [Cohnella fermenti]THF74689.1 tyrosine protein phosphatase [Cohnella fermenti]